MSVPNLTIEDARARAELLQVSSYDVTVDLTDGEIPWGPPTFRSRSEVWFEANSPGATTFIDVMADKLHEVTLNGEPVDVSGYTPEKGITLTNLAASNRLVVDADMLYTNTGEGLHRFLDPVDGKVYLYSQFETADAKRVYACFDQPDLKANFRFEVIAPRSWEIISNGELSSIDYDVPGQDHRLKKSNFALTERMSTYVTALIAGPYHYVTDHHDGIDLAIYCRQSLAQHLDADEIFLITKQGFDWYHANFDYRYPFGKYDQLFVSEFNAGAMGNAGAVTFLEDYVFRSKVTDYAFERRAETILHEMAHMWFGDLVTMRWWDDLWLNESFATFVSVLCQSRATRWTDAWTTFANIEKGWAYRQDQLPSTHPVACELPDVQAAEVNFDGITYAKGASVLKQLAAYVGIDPFLAGIRTYFKRHAYGNTTLPDLLKALEEASGRDLSGWSAQWLETAGINTIRIDATVTDGVFTSFALVQEAPTETATSNLLRDHRLAVGLYDEVDGKLVRVHREELDVTGARTEVPALIGLSAPAVVLVNDDDLTYCKIRLDERSLERVRDGIGTFADSLPRALCWSASWDMVRDGEMAARDFVTLVLNGIDAETDIGMVQSLQRQVAESLGYYSDPAWADSEGWRQWADKAHSALLAAEPGSDHQLAWARTFAGAVRDADHLVVLRAILDGTQVVNGLAVDDDLRWSLLNGLVALGSAGEPETEAEFNRDRTAAGQRHAAAARALIPTAEAKAKAWQLATEDDKLPNAINGAVIGGFTHPAQRELLAPYIARYFECVADVWKRRSSESAQRMVEGLFPTYAVAQSTVDACDAYLAENELPPALRRLLIEGRADVVRFLKARARA